MVAMVEIDQTALQAIQDKARSVIQAAMQAKDSGGIESLCSAIEDGKLKGLDEKADLAPASRLLADLEQKQRFMAFTDVPREEMAEMRRCRTREDVKALLMRCMRISNEDGFQSEILAEFHFHNFGFCQKQCFSDEQASAFLSIMRLLHQKSCADSKMSIQDAFVFFRQLMDGHSVQRPPYSVGVFSPAEAAVITEYVSETFFRHFKMYQYVYVKSKELHLQVVNEDLAPPVPTAVFLHESFEVDPREVPELKDMFEAEERAREAEAAALANQPKAPTPPPPKHPEVRKLLDDTADDLLGDLDGLIAKRDEALFLPPSAEDPKKKK